MRSFAEFIPMIKAKIQIITVVLLTIFSNCYTLNVWGQNIGNKLDDKMCDSLPPQPDNNALKFINDLKSPLWTNHHWNNLKSDNGFADLTKGVLIKQNFPDPDGVLSTAYQDLILFLGTEYITNNEGNFIIETCIDNELQGEAFIVETNLNFCKILAGDAEGIRRGIFYIEDKILSLRGAYLPLGIIKKEASIARRISRCSFAPIKRPPFMRDELLDSVNYYPDNYLNRLAHESVNGIWIKVELRELVNSPYYLTQDIGIGKRVEKLKQIVNSCKLYGIKVFIFCIEPKLTNLDIQKYPELIGANNQFFCPGSETAYQYLYSTVNNIFKEIPDLGGIINISHGERGTTCLSSVNATDPYYKGKINCPRCADKEPWEVLNASLVAMEKGMHDASPNAEFISWLYMPQDHALADWVYTLPAHTPNSIIFQFNFESGVTKTVFGKHLVGGDYWISSPGPSERFIKAANIAKSHHTSVSAKIQTSNSHELATVPYIPVPSLLYEKFHGMRKLGVKTTMLSWFFGSYPGMMLKGVDLLSFNSDSQTKDAFLNELANLYWKKEDISLTIKSWKLFADAFSYYPLNNAFQYYGPMHDGIVWPLYLNPTDTYLVPTWTLGSSYQPQPKVWPAGGDRIGECIGDKLTLNEVLELCRIVTTKWHSGLTFMEKFEENYANEPERKLDILVAKAIGLQFQSGYNILKFYSLREDMFRSKGRKRLKMLDDMMHIINAEIENSEKMIVLCHQDSRLGYHSEAEGYKYWPAKLEWRIKQLKRVLSYDFPAAKRLILNNQIMFPEYSGIKPVGMVMNCLSKGTDVYNTIQEKNNWVKLGHVPEKSKIKWASAYDKNNLYIIISDSSETAKGKIQIEIEPRRLWPVKYFNYSINKSEDGLMIKRNPNELISIIAIPLAEIGEEAQHNNPIRVNLQYGNYLWIQKHPWPIRLMYGDANPEDLGWLLFH